MLHKKGKGGTVTWGHSWQRCNTSHANNNSILKKRIFVLLLSKFDLVGSKDIYCPFLIVPSAAERLSYTEARQKLQNS